MYMSATYDQRRDRMEIKDYAGMAAAWIIAWAARQWAEIPDAVIGLMGLILIDYGTGVWSAIVRKEANSSRGFRGLMVKCGMLIALLTLHVMEAAAGFEYQLEKWLALAFIWNEGISILENLVAGGTPGIPPKLIAGLKRFKTLRFDLGDDDSTPVVLRTTTEVPGATVETTVIKTEDPKH